MTRRLHQIALLLIATSGVSMASPTDALAQGPTVIDLCYVQAAGLVYRIDPSGSLDGRLPRACKSPNSHFQFTLTDGAGADHGTLTGLGDDDHPEYVREGEAAGGDLSGTYPNPAIAADAVTAAEIAAGAVGSTEIADGSVGAADIDPLEVQRRVDSSCPEGESIRLIAADGTVTCETHDAGETSGAAGGDLTGTYPNPQIAADAVTAAEIATGAVGSPEILDESVGGADIDPDEVQRRVTGSCASGESIRLINTNGTVTCETDDTGVTDHGLLAGRGDDDHTQYVLANGVRSTTNGFAVTGALGTGAIPTFGAGVRLMWYPGKAAFRVGEVTGNQWADFNIGIHSTAMGFGTTASGHGSTAMGSTASARGDFSTAMGSNTSASGDHSTAMGFDTRASGPHSTAMGVNASTNGHDGSFVYGDNSTNSFVNASADNSFVVRAAGGTTFYSNADLTAGVSLAAGAGAWANVSDRNRKDNFRDEDGEIVLQKIADLPIPSWSYKSQEPSIRHLGPTAQDFYAAFGLGESDTTITTTDIDGVTMLAVQALERRTRDLQNQLEAKEQEITRLRADVDALVKRFERVEGKRSR